MRLPRPPALRIAALLALAVLLAPGTWWRSVVPDRYATAVRVEPLPFDQGEYPTGHGGLAVQGLWQVRGRGENFGGYSAMFLYGRSGIRLLSDRGFLLTIPRPGPDVSQPMRLSTRQLYPIGFPLEDMFDIESVTHDPATGQYWVGYENKHVIYRYAAPGDPQAYVRPDYTRTWPVNGGIEAMVRRQNGQFLVFRESAPELFRYAGDPVAGFAAQRFAVAWPAGFEPTDAAELPDGRVLVLLRKLAWHLPPFESRLALIDPERLEADAALPVTVLARIEQLLPRENWEALAVEPGARAGEVHLWLASDDNRSALQRSLLARVRLVVPPGNLPQNVFRP